MVCRSVLPHAGRCVTTSPGRTDCAPIGAPVLCLPHNTQGKGSKKERRKSVRATMLSAILLVAIVLIIIFYLRPTLP